MEGVRREALEKESRPARISFRKSGGTASKNATSASITLPNKWVKELGVTKEERTTELIYDPEKMQIVIQFHPTEATAERLLAYADAFQKLKKECEDEIQE